MQNVSDTLFTQGSFWPPVQWYYGLCSLWINHLIPLFWCSESKSVFERKKVLNTVLTKTVKTSRGIAHLRVRQVISGSRRSNSHYCFRKGPKKAVKKNNIMLYLTLAKSDASRKNNKAKTNAYIFKSSWCNT